MIERLWAGWRSAYVTGTAGVPRGEGSLFERILSSGLPDRESYVVWRGRRCAALLNAFPYTSGHLMVLPTRAVAFLDELEPDESAELWAAVNLAVRAVRAAYRPDGVNVGANLGLAAGAGVPDHLHLHVLPRWSGDTNFMTALAECRVMPEPLGVSWDKLRAAWPAE
jgi:ATP adenylyltransferase